MNENVYMAHKIISGKIMVDHSVHRCCCKLMIRNIYTKIHHHHPKKKKKNTPPHTCSHIYMHAYIITLNSSAGMASEMYWKARRIGGL